MFSTEEEILGRLNSNRNLLNQLAGVRPQAEPEDIEKSDEESSSPEIDDDVALSLLNGAMNDSPIRKGRGKQKTNAERSDIALMGALIGDTQAAEIYGASPMQPWLYEKGKVNYYEKDGIDEHLLDNFKKKLELVRDKATSKLNTVLDAITDDSLENLGEKPEVATRVGLNLARIVEKTMPKEREVGNNTQFIIMQNIPKKVEDYEIIDVP